MKELSFLRIAGVIETLLYLARYYPNGRRKIEIRSDLGLSPSTAVKAQRALFEAGLMQGISFTNANTLTLTPEGIEIARSLGDIRKATCDAAKKDIVKDSYMKWEIRKDQYMDSIGKKSKNKKKGCDK
nr:hypothetical protein [Candidatus Sigynarchaeum springense]MDO8116338.1 hypothetical protein [Candidatus Sigynarchaeota archaeon]